MPDVNISVGKRKKGGIDEPPVVKRFHGINMFSPITSVGPDFAIDLLNVIVSEAGLEKLRKPRNISTVPIANAGYGIASLIDFQQGDGTHQVIVGAYDNLYVFNLQADGVTFTPTLADTNPLNLDHAWSMIQSNNVLYMANLSRMIKWNGINLRPWGIGKMVNVPTLNVAGAGTQNTTLGGYKYRLALKCNDNDIHEGSASPLSAATGNLVNKAILVTPPADTAAIIALYPQVTHGVWYRTIDGGSEYSFHSEVAIVAGNVPVLTDLLTDAQLNKLRQACLINDVPVNGRYITEFGGRIVIGNLDGAEAEMIYSGYERVRNGRPEQSFPPNNRIRLAIGAAKLRGVGVIEAGVIAFSHSDEMFMLRGTLEDVVTDEPIAYSAVLAKLPWGIGCLSHFTIISTPWGLVWLSSQRSVEVYNGTGMPITISGPVSPILREITTGAEDRCQGVYWGDVDRDWYVLALPTNGATRPNKILVFDLDNDDSIGIFIFDVGEFDSLGIVEGGDGRDQLVIVQDGLLRKMITISATSGGVATDIDYREGVTLPAYWVPGYAGNDSPNTTKLFRWARITADNGGFRSRIRVIDSESRTIANPEIIPVLQDEIDHGKIFINRAGKRCTAEIIFPDEDMNITVTEYTPPVGIPRGVR